MTAPPPAARPTALVTGASRGIGRAIVRRLAGTHDVVAVARSADALAELAAAVAAEGGRCVPLVADIADPVASVVIADTLGALGALGMADGPAVDVLVHNAGVGTLRPLLELTAEEWRRMVDVNVNALYHVTRAVLPGMVARGRGHVVLIGSIAGRSAFVGGAGYAATKAFGMSFAESLLLEVRDAGIKVTVVSPGSVKTGFSGRAQPTEGPDWQLAPEDVAEAVAYAVATPPGVLVHRVEVRALSPKRARS